MLFNSIPFIFCFLPLVLAGFFLLGRYSRPAAAFWLTAASFFFYGWWDARYLGLLATSIAANFLFAKGIVAARRGGHQGRAGRLLALAIAANLVVLAYYKYANFFLSSLQSLTGWEATLGHIVLPLGISFFTFTQIAFLADCRRGLVESFGIVHYSLFVTYFPHLIAGPVLHHKEMMPQFAQAETYRPDWENLAVGATLFAIGLFKKVVLADGIAPYVGPVFAAAAADREVTFLEANLGALSYALQLYFDFSGYSDMAIGLSRMFGITLPLNFNSPYKAASIIDFWHRWHMTLSRFLRDYLYIPLGGNRHGRLRRHVNLLLTMLLGGLWHGAAWTFVLWGGLHGLLLVANHAWRASKKRLGMKTSAAGRLLGAALTFYLVVLAWVFFRADSLSAATSLVNGMLGGHGVLLPAAWLSHLGGAGAVLQEFGVRFGGPEAFVGRLPLSWLPWLLVIVWLAPNSQEFMRHYRPALDVPPVLFRCRWPVWRPSLGWGIFCGLLAWIGTVKISKVSEFLYFQF